MSSKRLLINIRSSFWYIPSLYGIISIFLALASLRLDYYVTDSDISNLIPAIFLTDIDLARTILSTISASLLTMTTITFSTILVVLTTFLSEFSPRTLQNFITDHSTQRVLGVFVGGFTYSILLLLFLRDDLSTTFIVPSFAVLLAIFCLIMFVFFINHVSKWMQVSNLIHNITLKIMKRIDQKFEDKNKVHEDAPWEDWESDELTHLNPKKMKLNTSGYIKHIDLYGIIKQATIDDYIIKIEKKVGEYVDQDSDILSIWAIGGHHSIDHYEKYISVAKEKAPVDDIEFGLTKIVEIALRALSPGVNDPNTAINCIENLGKILTKLGQKHLPRSYHNDANRNLRVIFEHPCFYDYLFKCFYQIRKYGFDDISVLQSALKAFTLICERNSKQIKDTIWEFTEHIIEGIDPKDLLTLDKKYINDELQRLAKASNKKNEYKPM
ncbi:hypothetical protein BKP35_01185 [Anaerobacillus arseniciselenatis]|uniref:DUF2254 domain-containing protein n=1 Tax=Anaerobacillus arseniciselenatis TaxID=85682 RepID=A0A1S2LVF3_9BACI|nr:DUF2254 domain-containing protein [Anaerobacillus arseniciselenatis]OIJ15637.1 hypothetical protein BKP35_01185 [Anaerobacillus arseniciselenatis]